MFCRGGGALFYQLIDFWILKEHFNVRTPVVNTAEWKHLLPLKPPPTLCSPATTAQGFLPGAPHPAHAGQ